MNAPPLFIAAAGLAAGILLSEAEPRLGPFALAAGVGTVSVFALLRAPSGALVTFGVFVTVGAVLGTSAVRRDALDCRMHLPDGARLRVQGTIASLPRDARAV